MTRLEELRNTVPLGIFVDTWSPGDGATRYRFSLDDRGYFGTSRAIYTALGWQEAIRFAQAFALGYFHGRGQLAGWGHADS